VFFLGIVVSVESKEGFHLKFELLVWSGMDAGMGPLGWRRIGIIGLRRLRRRAACGRGRKAGARPPLHYPR
jgi:hypothetical protein